MCFSIKLNNQPANPRIVPLCDLPQVRACARLLTGTVPNLDNV